VPQNKIIHLNDWVWWFVQPCSRLSVLLPSGTETEWPRLDACSFVTFGGMSKDSYRQTLRCLCAGFKQTPSQFMELWRNNQRLSLKSHASDVLLFMTVAMSCALYTQHRNPNRPVSTASPIALCGSHYKSPGGHTTQRTAIFKPHQP
jgi:hypothetical protein